MDYMGFLVIAAVLAVVSFVLLAWELRSIRFRKLSSPYEGPIMAYFESIRNVNPEEAIDYIVNYIQNPKWGCPPKDLPDFLFAMAERKDGFGEAARKKIRELGLFQNL